MRIGVLTYDCPHLKTEQIVNLLRARGEHVMSLVLLPFKPRPARQTMFQHRPAMDSGCHPGDLARWWSLEVIKVADPIEIPTGFKALIVAGAGLLPAEVVTRTPVVNAHSGLIPAVRGLDSFKWAIRDGMPLGNTLHLVDDGVDLGRHLASVRTPVFPNDSLEDLARRHYDLELALLSDFARHLARPEPEPQDLPPRPPRMRMPMTVESEMIQAFDAYRQKFSMQKAAVPADSV